MVELSSLTAIVPDWDLPEITIRCVRSLVDEGVPPGRIAVVENGSNDVTWEHISRALPACVLVRIDRNVGFARASNIGADVLPGTAYMFLNNDTFVHRPGSIKRLLETLERTGAGIVVPRVVNEDHTLQPTVAPFTTPRVALARASGLSRLIPNRWQPTWSTHWDHLSTREIEAAIGAVVLVRGETWQALRGFGETSYMYTEDLDLCWRARKHGWKTWFESEAEFVHLGGTTAATHWGERERAERVGRAEAEMIRRHLPPAHAFATLAVMRAGVAIRTVYFGLIGNNLVAASCRGFLRGYGMPPPGAPEVDGNPVVSVVRPHVPT